MRIGILDGMELDEAQYTRRLEELVETRGSYYLAEMELGNPPYEVVAFRPVIEKKLANRVIEALLDEDDIDPSERGAQYNNELSPYLPFPPAKTAEQSQTDANGRRAVSQAMTI